MQIRGLNLSIDENLAKKVRYETSIKILDRQMEQRESVC